MTENNISGTVTFLEKEEDSRFLYYFMSMNSFIKGWKYVRPVIVVDGTFLKSKFHGSLLTACGMDGNQQIFPLAFGIVDNENNASWQWFIEKLKSAIGDREELAFISDRHDGILNAVKSIYPNAYHGYCMHHLLHNLKACFNVSKAIKWKFACAAQAYTVAQWEIFMSLLDNEDPDIRPYLQNDVGYDKWARSHFPGRRYSMMTSNNAESMNACDRKARELPVVKLLEWLRSKMQEWFYDRHEKGLGTFTALTPHAEKQMKERFGAAQGMAVSKRYDT